MVTFAYAVCALVWGTTWYAIRVCIEPGGYTPLGAAAVRFSLAAVVLGGLYLVGIARPGPRGRRDQLWMVAAGVANAGSYGLIYLAEQHIPGGLAATLFSLFPLAVALLAAASGTERPTRAAILGSVIGLVGVLLIFRDRWSVSTAQAGAVAMGLTAVVLSALYSVIFKHVTTRQHPLAATGVFAAITAVGLWCVAGVSGSATVPWPLPGRASLAILYLALMGTVLVFGCYIYLMRHISLMAVSTLVFIEPIIALAVDAVWEHDVRLDSAAYAGIAVVLAGVSISVFGSRLARAGLEG